MRKRILFQERGSHFLRSGAVEKQLRRKRIKQMVPRFFQITLLALSTLAARAACETLPRMESETLTGKSIVLPDAARGKIALLAIGCSKKSGDRASEWGKRFKQDFGKDSNYVVYPVAELEAAPRFVRGMIKGGMRRGTPLDEQDRFVLLFQGEADWKKFVGFATADEAYLVLLNANGEVKWRGHGVLSEEGYAPLREAAKQLAAR